MATGINYEITNWEPKIEELKIIGLIPLVQSQSVILNMLEILRIIVLKFDIDLINDDDPMVKKTIEFIEEENFCHNYI